MQYKTIALELAKQSAGSANNSLISRMETLALQLRERHLALLSQLKAQQADGSNEILMSSQALELAIEELKDDLGL